MNVAKSKVMFGGEDKARCDRKIKDEVNETCARVKYQRCIVNERVAGQSLI